MDSDDTKKCYTCNILYFGSFDLPYDTERYVADTLETLGCKVTRKTPTKVSLEELKELVKQEWDFILMSKGWFNFSIDLVNNTLYSSLAKRVGWFWDLGWETPREAMIYSHHLFKANLVLTSDGGHDEKWKEHMINHKVLRQGIFEPEAVKGNYRQEYAYDVVFVGTNVHKDAFGWSHRGRLIDFLKKNYGTRFKWLGGKGQEIRNAELNDLYASAKVVVGDSVNSRNYWSNRIYETLGRGGFLIFPEVEGIETEFTPYEHFVPYTYSDFDGLKEKIDYYINHDEERNKIRDAGFEFCKKHHTYTHRCKELLELVKTI